MVGSGQDVVPAPSCETQGKSLHFGDHKFLHFLRAVLIPSTRSWKSREVTSMSSTLVFPNQYKDDSYLRERRVLIAEPETKPRPLISQLRNLFTSVCFRALWLLILRAEGQVLCWVWSWGLEGEEWDTVECGEGGKRVPLQGNQPPVSNCP